MVNGWGANRDQSCTSLEVRDTIGYGEKSPNAHNLQERKSGVNYGAHPDAPQPRKSKTQMSQEEGAKKMGIRPHLIPLMYPTTTEPAIPLGIQKLAKNNGGYTINDEGISFEAFYNDVNDVVMVWFKHPDKNSNLFKATEFLSTDEGTKPLRIPLGLEHKACVIHGPKSEEVCIDVMSPARPGILFTYQVSDVIAGRNTPAFNMIPYKGTYNAGCSSVNVEANQLLKLGEAKGRDDPIDWGIDESYKYKLVQALGHRTQYFIAGLIPLASFILMLIGLKKNLSFQKSQWRLHEPLMRI